MPCEFQDQLHVERIAEALWQRRPSGNAAVMVGAGFSRNAQPLLPHDRRPPTWVELASRLVDALYPVASTDGSERRDRALRRSQGSSGFLRLAQEFEATFGEQALENLLIDAVADERQEPAELHHLLLELPWADIFTTNWDTLLERASPKIRDRRFDIVRTIGEIPRSARPRIVKLHGTLPSLKPFIFTEEHYRTYPAKNAPFVNLVQQSMMENVFCLLGFSGDDPNFLAWSGWVRDHLGPSAPKIFLVGWLDASPAERKMLEDRNVVPVDLSRLPQASQWPGEKRHLYSLEWFLQTLKASQPPSPLTWPKPGTAATDDLPARLLPLGIPDTRSAQTEQSGPSNGEDEITQLRQAQTTWRNNRKVYPGWIVAPRQAREQVWAYTVHWLPTILATIAKLDVGQRLRLLYEVNWRFEVSLTPLFNDIAAEIAKTLEECSQPTAGASGESSPTLDPAAELREEWAWLSFALLRWAREQGRPADVTLWNDRLSAIAANHAELGHRLQYECCLWALSRLDYGQLRRLLKDWEIPKSEPFWMARKAGLLVQAGQVDQAATLSESALEEIRERQPRDAADITSLSQEGWTMIIVSSFESYRETKEWDEDDDLTIEAISMPRQDAFTELHRWKDLRRYEIDPWNELDTAQAQLSLEPPTPEPDRIETQEFDPGHRSIAWKGVSYGGASYKNHPGLQFIRLCEETCLPPVVTMIDLTSSTLKRVVVWMQTSESLRASTVLLQASTSATDDAFHTFFSRIRIARMHKEVLSHLGDAVTRCLDFGLQRLSHERNQPLSRHERFFWSERLHVMLELLSRLAVRSDLLDPVELLEKALRYYRLRYIQEDPRLYRPLSNLFERAFAAISPNSRGKAVLNMAMLPLQGSRECDVKGSDWPDPLRNIEIGRTLAARAEELPRWAQANHRLLEAAGGGPSRVRTVAIRRLERIHRLGLLTEVEARQFAEILWTYPFNKGSSPEFVGN